MLETIRTAFDNGEYAIGIIELKIILHCWYDILSNKLYDHGIGRIAL